MRIGLLALLALLVGTSIGLGMTWMEFRGVNEHFQAITRTQSGSVGEEAPPPKVVVVDGRIFDFGVLNHDQVRDKTFVIRNDGGKPLSIAWSGQSCGMCILNNHHFANATIEPGETYNVIVSYATKKPGPKFSESAYLTTNDPENSSLHLQITGDVVKAVRVDPETLTLNSILATESTTGSVKLIGYESDKLELVKTDFSNPDVGALFEVTAKPMDAEAVKKIEHARTGLELVIKVKPGLPIGPISQNVAIKVRTETEHSLELPIKGTVTGDLSLIGKFVDPKESTFSMGLVSSEQGRTSEIFVLVKGPYREDVKLTVGEVDPPEMKVSVGEPIPVSEGKMVKHPIIINIPKGTRPMNRLGNAQGKVARFVLHTTHPHSKELAVDVRFSVE